MSVLRIRCDLNESPLRSSWVLTGDPGGPVEGEGRLADLPRAGRIQLVLPADAVVFIRPQLPRGSRHDGGPVLAFAIEDETLGDPEANHVIRAPLSVSTDTLAVFNKQKLACWHEALVHAGIQTYDVHCETLLLPRKAGEWSLAWNGREAFVRSEEFEGAATDCGTPEMPPLTLRLMIEEARRRGNAPDSIALFYGMTDAPDAGVPGAAPNLEAWQNVLGVKICLHGPWDWRTATHSDDLVLMQQRRNWRVSPEFLARLRPASWLLAAALGIHVIAGLADWVKLGGEQRMLRERMEARFRQVIPDAVAVVDPALQMRRKLAEARHSSGLPDAADFIPMIEKIGTAMDDLPAGSVRSVSYENGRMTMEVERTDTVALQRAVARLRDAGLKVDDSAGDLARGAGLIALTVRSI